MPELPDREELEAKFARKFGAIGRRHGIEYAKLLGNPPDESNVPNEFWDMIEKEVAAESFALLFLIWSRSAELHGWYGPDMRMAGTGWAHWEASRLGRYWSESTRTMIDNTIELMDRRRLRERRRRRQETLREHLDRHRPGQGGQSDHERPRTPQDEFDTILRRVFGPERVTRVVMDETTIARHRGGESAIEATVGISQNDIWKCAEYENGVLFDNVCEKCSPNHDQPRWNWDEEFQEGPPVHPSCQCWVQYENLVDSAHWLDHYLSVYRR